MLLELKQATTTVFKKIAEFVMRGRLEAIMTALLCSVIPFLGWFGATIMSLVTLRKGAREGLLVLICIAIPSIALFTVGYRQDFYYHWLAMCVVVWMLACVLRATASWHQTIVVGVLLGLATVLVVHFMTENVASHWYSVILNYYKSGKGLSTTLGQAELDAMTRVAKMATGIIAAMFLFVNLLVLGFGRWLQALLYNPGGFGNEVNRIRFGIGANIALLVNIAAIFLGYDVAWDLLPIILLVFFVSGLSLFHAVIKYTKHPEIWIVVFYGLLLIFFQYVAIIIIMAAIIDSWLDVRAKPWIVG